MEYRYRAIVLGKKEVGETDRLYTLYTREQGKIRVMAKGVRKPEAKLAGQLENLSLTLIIINKTKGMGRVTAAVAEDVFGALREQYEILLLVSQCLSILEKFVDMEEPDEALFGLTREYLIQANTLAQENKPERIRLLSQVFLFQLFSHLGYHIETHMSVQSGAKLIQGQRHFFSPQAGGVLNEAESREYKESFYIQENTIKLMRLFATNDLRPCMKLQVNEQDMRELEMVTRRFADWIAH
jgi:DNA repair protein RecO (recombination protein O)